MSPARTRLSALALAVFAWTAPAAAQVTGDWNDYKLLPAPPKGQAPAPDLGAPSSAQPGTAPSLPSNPHRNEIIIESYSRGTMGPALKSAAPPEPGKAKTLKLK
jgi:hypothetical protein